MRKQLLIVDDDLCLRNSISSYLIEEGFLVNTADTVQSALHIIRNNKPDLIIADIMMPHLDGYDLITILRADQIFAAIPVIFLTAKGLTNDRIFAYELGCNAYLTKPFSPQELVSIVNNVFNNIELLVSKLSLSSGFTAINSSTSILSRLNKREQDVLLLVSKGLMNKEIALRLNLSQRNIEKYVSRLLSKTNTRNRTELAQFALSQNINDLR